MNGKLVAVQYLRGVAAVLVMIGHVQINYAGWTAPWLKGHDRSQVDGQFGVDVFFIISGFIMYHVAGRTFGSARSGAGFLIRRFLRIAPLYWICTILAAMMLLKDREVVLDATLLKHVVQSFLFVPYGVADGKFRPVQTVGWTLDYEMFFYLIFAACLCFRRAIGLGLGLLAFGALILFGALHLAHPAQPVLWAWSRPIIGLFMIGVLIGLVYEARGAALPKIPESMALGLIAAVLVVQTVLYNMRIGYAATAVEVRPLSWALAILAVGIGVMASPPARPRSVVSRTLLALGDSSYSLYLTHSFAIYVLIAIWIRLDRQIPVPVMMVSSAAAALIGGYLCYRLVERPLHQFARTAGDYAVGDARAAPPPQAVATISGVGSSKVLAVIEDK